MPALLIQGINAGSNDNSHYHLHTITQKRRKRNRNVSKMVSSDLFRTLVCLPTYPVPDTGYVGGCDAETQEWSGSRPRFARVCLLLIYGIRVRIHLSSALRAENILFLISSVIKSQSYFSNASSRALFMISSRSSCLP